MNGARRFALGLVLAACVLGGCHTGPRIEDVALARKPAGASVRVEFLAGKRPDLAGELLAIDERVVYVNAPGGGGWQVTRAPLVAVAEIRAESRDVRKRYWQSGQKYLEQLRLLARFPQGLSPPLLDALLAAQGQSALVVVEP